MSETVAYRVRGMTCDQCKTAVTEELTGITGVETVAVDLDSKVVEIVGEALDDAALRAAIDKAGYEVA